MTRPRSEREEARRRPPPRRGRVRPARLVAVVLLAVVCLLVGFALGEALHGNPEPGGTQTGVHTYPPLQPAPVPATVTVTAP